MRHVQSVCLLLLSVGVAVPAHAWNARDRAIHDLKTLALGHPLGDVEVEDRIRPTWNAPEASALNSRAAAELDEAIRQVFKSLRAKWGLDQDTELRFLLAGFWDEKALYLETGEDISFNEQLRQWHQCRAESDAKACGPAPRLSHEESDYSRQQAMEMYDSILHRAPQYKRNDEVRFRLAQHHLHLASRGENRPERRKHRDEALALLRSVVELSPKSAVAGDALVSLGDELFDGNHLKPACDAFEQAAKLNAASSGLYAKFMVGWCDSLRGENETATRRFQEVVALASQAKGKNATLKDRALRALVDVFAAREQFEEARAYYSKTVGEQGARAYLTSIARVGLVNQQYKACLHAFRSLLQDAPDDARAPTWQAGVVVALSHGDSVAETAEAARELVQRYGEGSAWRERVRGSQEAIDRANEAVWAARKLAP